MGDFNIIVDTSEMAEAIHNVSPHVDGTTAAVLAMQGAVIVAEKNAADQICGHVNRGFFNLIRSQVTQKMAVARSLVEARLLELRDQSSKLHAVKNMMERDFNMIAARYSKLFRVLDAALFTRVHQVDEPVVDLVQRDWGRMQRRSRSVQASLPQHQLESLRSSQLIATSGARDDAQHAITSMSGFLVDSARQGLLLNRILGEEGKPVGIQGVPVLIYEVDGLSVGSSQSGVDVPQAAVAGLQSLLRTSLDQSVMTHPERLQWIYGRASTRARIEPYFIALCHEQSKNDRVRKTTEALFTSSQWSELQGMPL